MAVPGVLALVKGRGMSAVSGEITEAKLVQGYVAAGSAGGCGPGAEPGMLPEVTQGQGDIAHDAVGYRDAASGQHGTGGGAAGVVAGSGERGGERVLHAAGDGDAGGLLGHA